MVDSQLTVAPKISASSVMLSSVARSKFFRESWTSEAFWSFFSREGRAAFLGGAIWNDLTSQCYDQVTNQCGLPVCGGMCV